MTKKYTIVTNDDDWEGLYIDGVLYCEGHTLRKEDIFSAMGIVIENITACDHIADYGSLPYCIIDLEPDSE